MIQIFLIKIFTKWLDKLKKNQDNSLKPSSNTIISLAPKTLTEEKDITRIKPYLDALQKGINDKDVSNIALTGGYGSGKSTIIKTFQDRNEIDVFLNISLASFKDNTDDDEKLERKLEISILQQIFYHVKPSDIPDSRFKRIINVTSLKIWTIAVSMVLWAISAITLFKFDYINKISPSTWDYDKSFDWYFIFILIIFFTGIGLFAKTVVRLFSNSKINKFNIKGELELGDNIDKSVFNQHLEEILYFFERTKFNVVVIEDLDRFESTDIFTKLREINILLNNSNLIDRKVTFLYAIKDEIFNDKNERVKFFEFIIPVIPFINPSNAGDQLTRLIKEASLDKVLSKEFTEDVVTFIDDIDMRLLTNIFHEYCIYKENLSPELPQDELFAMIVYKNISPSDFAQLHNRKGDLYGFITNKNQFIKDLKIKNEAQIEIYTQEIKKIEAEKISNIKELRSIYLNHIIFRIPNATTINLGGHIEFSAILENENFNNLHSSTATIKYSGYQHYYNNQYNINNNLDSGITFSQIEKSVNPKFTYLEREKFISDKNDSSLNNLKLKIEELKVKNIEIEALNLKEIFQEIDINPFLDTFSGSLLMRNLLLNGYLNENYNDYISLFHEINITKDDFAFEKKIKSGIHLPYDYKLEKVENLLKRINVKYLSREVILNYNLMDFLSINSTKYRIEYDSIFKVLSPPKDSSIKFIESYINRGLNVDIFIKQLCKSWNGFWIFITTNNFPDDKITEYLKLIIANGELDDISKFKKEANIATYIENTQNLLESLDPNTYTKFEKIITKLNIKFHHLKSPNTETKKIFDFIYHNNLYQFNESNINILLNEYDKVLDKNQLKESNYSTILKSECKELISYIDSNIEEYVTNVLLKISENIDEAEDVIIRLLNSEVLDGNLKTSLILKQITPVNKLSLIDNLDIQQILIKNNKISSSWNNVIEYYKNTEKVFDEHLISFLNISSNYIALGNNSLKSNNDEPKEFIDAFSDALINCASLSLDSYKNVQKSIPYTYNSIELANLDESKVSWMVQSKFLNLTTQNFSQLKKKSNDLHLKLIENNQDKFIESFEKYTLDNNDKLLLLKSLKLSKKNKIELIKKIDDNLIIENKDIAQKVCEILANAEYFIIRYEVIKSMFENSTSLEDRIKILNIHIESFNESQIQTLIELLGEDYKRIFKKQNKPTFSHTSYHKDLFENLVKKKLIHRYEVNSKEDEIKVIANY